MGEDQSAETVREAHVREALARAVGSEQFAQTPQLVGFLTYVVERTLANRADEIKAYTIAVDALGKPEDFDPQNNASVRVMAGRLRRELELHNVTLPPGAVRITLPKGSYVPVFDRVPAVPEPLATQVEEPSVVVASEPAAPHPTVVPGRVRRGWLRGAAVLAGAVLLVGLAAALGSWTLAQESDARDVQRAADRMRLPTLSSSVLAPAEEYPRWFSNAQMADDMDTVVSRFDDYTYLGTSLYRKRNAKGIAPLPGPEGLGDYHIHVTSYPFADQMRIFVRIERTADGAQIWSRRYVVEPPGPTGEELLELMGLNFSPLGSPYGVIYSDLLRVDLPRAELRCILAAHRYFAREDDALRARTLACTQALIAEGSRVPAIHAVHAIVLAEGDRDGDGAAEGAVRDLERARISALHAVEFGPDSARAHQAQHVVNRAMHRYELAEQSARRAFELNPYDATIVATLGSWLVRRGEAREGQALFERIIPRGDIHDTRFGMMRVLAADLSGDEQDAIRVGRTLDPLLSADAATGALIAAVLERDDERAASAYRELVRHSPDFARDPYATLERRHFVPIVAAHVARMVRTVRDRLAPEQS